jgi:hypothetical protein
MAILMGLILCLASWACGTSEGGADASDATTTPPGDTATPTDPGTGTDVPGTDTGTDPGTATGGTWACSVPENHDCMEFSGFPSDTVRDATGQICTTGGGQWAAGACAKGALGACDVPRTDGVKQTVLCYDKAMGLPPADQIGYCQQACPGTFTSNL